MKKSLPKFYWDANLFLAWITNEKRKKGEMEGLAEVTAMVTGREALIITSVMTRVEVLESTLSTNQANMFDNLFKRRNVKMVDTTGPIALLAHKIRDFYLQKGKDLKVPGLSPWATSKACLI